MDKKAIFKKGSTTYYYSSLFFPPDVKEHVFNIYAFVRTIDNFVDEKPQQPEKLKQYKRETKKAFEGIFSRNELIDSFVKTAQNHDIPWQWVESFFDSMEADLHKKEYKTFVELETYIYGSADVIGLMMARIMALPREAEKAAALQGKAMQLINFIRDVREDSDLGRQYIPTEDLKRFGLSTLNPKTKTDREAFARLIRFEIERYRKIQDQASVGYDFIPPRYRIPVKTAADLYNWTAKQISTDPMIVFEKKVKPKPWQVIAMVLRNYCTTTP